MNRNQDRQLDDLVRRFSAGRAPKPEPRPIESEENQIEERAPLKPTTILILTVLIAIFVGLLIAF